MTSTIAKPSFREVVAVTTMNLDDLGLTFNAQRVGPTNFAGLRNADYGSGFRMPTMPELIPLVYASLENKDQQTAKGVIKTLKQNWLTGNTGILYTKKGMFVQDNPILEDGRIQMDQKYLEAKIILGSNEERGVFFSDDKSMRFVPYGFKTQSQTALELATNPGVIALAGSPENAERLAKASEHYRVNPYFYALSDSETPQTRVAELNSNYFGCGLYVNASDSGDYDDRCSFGVSEDTKGVAPKK